MLFKRVVTRLAVVFGFLGLIACLAAAYGIWLLGSRVDEANEKAFAMVDRGLASAQDRLRAVQERVKESKITTTEIEQKLRAWGSRKVKERLVSQLELEDRTEKLAGHLHTAGSWLETSIASLRGVQQVLELGNWLGAPVNPASLEDVLEKLTAVRNTLQQTEQTVDGMRESMASKGEWEEHRLLRITKLVVRTLLTISEIDTRLEESQTQLSQIKTDAQELKVRTSHYLLLATIGCYLVLAWIAAGQAALCLCGWKHRGSSSA